MNRHTFALQRHTSSRTRRVFVIALAVQMFAPAGLAAGAYTSLGGAWKNPLTWDLRSLPPPDASVSIKGGTTLGELNALVDHVDVSSVLTVAKSGALTASSLSIGAGLFVNGSVTVADPSASITVTDRLILGSVVNEVNQFGVPPGTPIGTVISTGDLSITQGIVSVTGSFSPGGTFRPPTLGVFDGSTISIEGPSASFLAPDAGLGLTGDVFVTGAGKLVVDRIRTATPGQPGAAGSLTVNGGEVLVLHSLGGAGHSLISGGGKFESFGTGAVGGGSFQVQGSGSTARVASDFTVNNGNNNALSNGSLTVTEGGLLEVDGAFLRVGNGGLITVEGPGSLLLASDARLEMTSLGHTGTVTVRNQAGLFVKSLTSQFDTRVTIDGGRLEVADEVEIGTSSIIEFAGQNPLAAGFLDVRAGGKLSSANGYVGRTAPAASGSFSSGIAKVLIDGEDSEWIMNGALTIGGGSPRLGRDGVVVRSAQVAVRNGGLLTAQAVYLGDPLPEEAVGTGRNAVLAIGDVAGSFGDAGRLVVNDDINIGRFGLLLFNHNSTNYVFDTALESIGFQQGVLEQRAGITHLTGRLDRFTGNIEVNGGSLFIESAAGATSTTVNSGGRLGGAASVAGAVRLNNGATMFGGQDNNPFTMSTLFMTSGAQLNIGIEALSPVPIFDVRNDVTLDGTLNISANNLLTPGLYRLLNYGGGLSNHGLEIGGVSGTLDPSDFSVYLGAPGQVNLIYDGGLDGEPFMGDGNGHLRIGGDGWSDLLGHATPLAAGGFVVLHGAGRVIALDAGGGALRFSGIQFADDGFTLSGDALTVDDTVLHLRLGNGAPSGAAIRGTIDAALVGAGTVEMEDLGTLEFAGQAGEFAGLFHVMSGHLVLSGQLGGTLLVDEGATLSGNGTVGTLSLAGTLAPGNSPGHLVVVGDYVQDATGELIMEIGGSPASGLFDVLQVGGTAFLGGTLKIVLVDGFEPLPGMSYDFLAAASIDGIFEHILAPEGFNFALDNLGSTLRLTITSAVPIPSAIWGFDCAVAALVLQSRRRARRA